MRDNSNSNKRSEKAVCIKTKKPILKNKNKKIQSQIWFKKLIKIITHSYKIKVYLIPLYIVVIVLTTKYVSSKVSKDHQKDCINSVAVIKGPNKGDRGLAFRSDVEKSKKNLNEIILNLTEKLPGMNLDVEVAARSLRDLTAAHRNINSKEN